MTNNDIGPQVWIFPIKCHKSSYFYSVTLYFTGFETQMDVIHKPLQKVLRWLLLITNGS